MKKSGQQAGNRPVRAGRGTGRADGKTSQGGARNSPGQKKGAGLPNLRDIPPSEQGKLNFVNFFGSDQNPWTNWFIFAHEIIQKFSQCLGKEAHSMLYTL